MQKTVAELARLVGGEVVGNGQVAITGVNGITEAHAGDITFLANPKYHSLIESTKASALIVGRDVSSSEKPLIRVDNPSLAFTTVIASFVTEEAIARDGVHARALIAADAQVGKNVSIGPYAVVESMARIGENTVIGAGCYVGRKTTIGSDCLIYPNTTIREHITIGDRVIIHSGTVVGSDGFGFIYIDGEHKKIPQIGTVVVEDDVEIGANVTIDRARFDKTRIGRGTKIDNLVQIAHNVTIGEKCLIIAQVGIAGSATIRNGAILAGQVGVIGHITVGEGAICTARSAVTKDVPAHAQVWGNPAKPHMEAKRLNAYMQRLPTYVEMIKELQARVAALEAGQAPTMPDIQKK